MLKEYTRGGILSGMSQSLEDKEIELALESVFDVAMETASKKQIISAKTRDNLPDSAFGVIYTTEEGKNKRLYPLIVEDKEQTRQLINRAIEYFSYCNPIYKPQLANNILKAIKQTGIKVKVHPRNTLRKYVDIPSKYIVADTVNEFNKTNKEDDYEKK
jgi:hypothetical protein